jgi:hypothetical protein
MWMHPRMTLDRIRIEVVVVVVAAAVFATVT